MLSIFILLEWRFGSFSTINGNDWVKIWDDHQIYPVILIVVSHVPQKRVCSISLSLILTELENSTGN